MSGIQLGVVGYGGRISGMITGPFRQIAPDLQVAGIVDPDEAGVRARLDQAPAGRGWARDGGPVADDVLFYRDLDAMVKGAKIDALAVGTRCNLHTPIALRAARHRLPLFLEKPVAVDMRQARALESAFENSKCQVVVSFPLRVSPLCELARQYIEEGAVGDPVHVTATNYVPYGTVYWEAAYRDYDVTHGLFLQKATHDFDYLMYLMGQPIVRVAATATRGHIYGGDKPAGLRCSTCDEVAECLESPQNRQRNSSGGNTNDHLCLFSTDCGEGHRLNEDASSALLEFADGSHGIYTQVFYARRDAGTRGANVSGYLGSVAFDWFTDELKRVRHHAPFSAVEKASGVASHFGGDLELGRDFVELIQHGAAPRTPIQTGLQSVYACLAAKESVEKGRFVNVRAVGQG
ncbi:MAG: Gfo/Idh/MocA family oxidoreductase [Gemmatimonadetes bacterium]|jgi:predicted dehydrogenase|nr:Gfo/Idh/MocA family oxidoreductase [Gemmatimonadota bacterium]